MAPRTAGIMAIPAAPPAHAPVAAAVVLSVAGGLVGVFLVGRGGLRSPGAIVQFYVVVCSRSRVELVGLLLLGRGGGRRCFNLYVVGLLTPATAAANNKLMIQIQATLCL